MNKVFGNFFYICGEIWKSIGLVQKVSIVLIGMIGVVALSTVLWMGTRPDWQVLYTGLDMETAAKVSELVKEEGIEVKYKDSGRTILVPYKHVSDLRLKATKSGVVKGNKGIGFELFDKVDYGMTNMQQRVNLKRANQGELRRNITQIPGVIDANVTLALPERRVFQDAGTGKATASVFLTVEQHHVLSDQQVESIRNMVAGSIDGLEPTAVTVTDSAGRMLARSTGSAMDGSREINNQLQVKRQMERELRQKAEQILRPFVGNNAVVAMVSAEIEFDDIEKEAVTYDKEGAVVKSERIVSEEQEKPAGSTGGAVGSSANRAGTTDGSIAVNNPEGEKMAKESLKTTDNQYLVPTTVAKTKVSGPRLMKISVAVTIAKATGEDAKARTATEIASLEKLVASAVGAQIEVGADGSAPRDMVKVVEEAFVNGLAKAEGEDDDVVKGGAMKSVEDILKSPLTRPIGGLILLMFLYYLFGMNFRKSKVEVTELGGGFGDSDSLVGGSGLSLDRPTPSSMELVMEKAQASPEAVAGALEQWMSTES